MWASRKGRKKCMAKQKHMQVHVLPKRKLDSLSGLPNFGAVA